MPLLCENVLIISTTKIAYGIPEMLTLRIRSFLNRKMRSRFHKKQLEPKPNLCSNELVSLSLKKQGVVVMYIIHTHTRLTGSDLYWYNW